MARHDDKDAEERDESRSEDDEQERRDERSEDDARDGRHEARSDDEQERRDERSEDDARDGRHEARSDDEQQDEGEDRSSRSAASDGRGHISALGALQTAKQQLTELIGHPTESVSASTKTDQGWDVIIEVVELERIPSSTDVLASYKAALDGDGNVMEYQRTRRYYRNRADEGD